MNIKEHIEAGHYPDKDGKGRALVPMADGDTFVCATTEKPGPHPLLGWRASTGEAVISSADSARFLSPPPRKVPVSECYVAINPVGAKVMAWPHPLTDRQRLDYSECHIVALTGEIELPWEDAQ